MTLEALRTSTASEVTYSCPLQVHPAAGGGRRQGGGGEGGEEPPLRGGGQAAAAERGRAQSQEVK